MKNEAKWTFSSLSFCSKLFWSQWQETQLTEYLMASWWMHQCDWLPECAAAALEMAEAKLLETAGSALDLSFGSDDLEQLCVCDFPYLQQTKQIYLWGLWVLKYTFESCSPRILTKVLVKEALRYTSWKMCRGRLPVFFINHSVVLKTHKVW